MGAATSFLVFLNSPFAGRQMVAPQTGRAVASWLHPSCERWASVQKRWLFVGKGETPEVAIFIRLGMSPRQAAEFCRLLDDRPLVGISGCSLAARIVRVISTEYANCQNQLDTWARELENHDNRDRGQQLLF